MEKDDSREKAQRSWIAHLLGRELRAAGATDVTYDDAESTMRIRTAHGNDLVLNLSPLFQECVGANADDRAASIQRFVAATTSDPQSMPTWAEAAPRLRPLLRAAGDHRVPESTTTPISREFQPFLHEKVVIDHPQVMDIVTDKHLRAWEVTASSVFERARANLAALAEQEQPEDPIPDGVFRFVEQGDDYWASRLLLDGWLAKQAKLCGGRPVAFLPDTSFLTIVKDEPGIVATLLQMSEDDYLKATRAVSPQAYTVDDAGRVVPYTVPRDNPLWNAVHRSEVLYAYREYTAQKEEHDDVFDGFIASLMVKELPDNGRVSVTVWGDDVYGLLPRADYVAFINENRDTFLVPWDVVVRETGLEPEPGWSPARYRVQTWPEPSVIARLRMAEATL